MDQKWARVFRDLTDGLAGPANVRHLGPSGITAAGAPPFGELDLPPAMPFHAAGSVQLELEGKTYAFRVYPAGRDRSY